MKLSYRALAKWSSALKVIGSVMAIALTALHFYLDPGLLTTTFSRVILVLLFFVLIALASTLKHSLKAYGLAISVWLAIFLPVYTYLGGASSLSLAISLVASFLLLVIPGILYSYRGSWRIFVISFFLYVILVLPLVIYLFLGNKFVTALESARTGNLSSIAQLLLSQNPLGLSFVLPVLGLVSFLMLSYSPGVKPFQALRSVGLTYPAIPILGSLFLYVMEGKIDLSVLVFAVGSLVTIPLSLVPRFKRNFVPLGLFTSTASMILGGLLYSISPSFLLTSLMTIGAGGSVIPRGLTDPDKVMTKLVESIRIKKFNMAKRYVSFLESVGYSTSSIACSFARSKNCAGVLWLMDNYDVKYDTCQNLREFADCIISSGRLPSRLDPLLVALNQRDKEYAEKLAGLVLAKAQDERTRDTAKRIISGAPTQEKLKLPSWTSGTNLWVNREIYGYTVKKVVGKGGTAYVLLAERGGSRYAVKVPLLTPTSSGQTRLSRTTFADLAGESSKLQEISAKTEDMVTLFGVFVDRTSIKEILSGKVEVYLKSPPAMVMEFMGGGDVESLLKEQAVFYSEKWNRIVAFIVLRVARALDVVHREGYVHLDVKTRNIFFSSPPGRSGEEVLENLTSGRVRAKLGDLGASRKIGGTIDQYTSEYCPVDQVQAMLLRGGAQPSMDVYALGATAYKMLTGETLNPPEVVQLMDGAVDEYLRRGNFSSMLDQANAIYQRFYSSLTVPGNPELANVVRMMVNPDPNRRPTAGQVVSYLERALKSMG